MSPLVFAQVFPEFEERLESYNQGYAAVPPAYIKHANKSEFVDSVACVKEIAEIRKHRYKVFAEATGASVGVLLGIKAFVDKQLPNEIKFLKSLESINNGVVNKIGNQSENAIEVASKIKQYDANNKIFLKGFADLEKWLPTLDQKTSGYGELSRQISLLRTRIDMNQKLVPEIERLRIELSAAKPEAAEGIRKQLVDKSLKHIQQAKIISADFSDFITNKVFSMAIRSHQSAEASAAVVAARNAKYVARGARLAAGAGALAIGLVENAVMGVAVEGVYDMAEGASLAQANFQNILKERSAEEDRQYCNTVLAFDKSKTLFNKNMTLLKTASFIDDGKITKINERTSGYSGVRSTIRRASGSAK